MTCNACGSTAYFPKDLERWGRVRVAVEFYSTDKRGAGIVFTLCGDCLAIDRVTNLTYERKEELTL